MKGIDIGSTIYQTADALQLTTQITLTETGDKQRAPVITLAAD